MTTSSGPRRGLHACAVFAAAIVLAACAGLRPQSGAEALNMELVGHDDLQARSAYQPTIQNQDGRWIAYIGHHGGTAQVPKPVNPLTGQPEFNGTSIVDVTDPAHPKYLFHIPGEEGQDEGGGAQMVRVCSGRGLAKADPSHFYMLRVFGNSAHEVWDVTNPSAPVRLARLGGLKGTHKNWWECDTGIAYLVSGVEGWRTRRMTQVYDLSDPAHPVFIRYFGLPGQQPGATGPVPIQELHGPISTGPTGNRVYFEATRHQQERHRPDRRPQETAGRPARTHRREPAVPAGGPPGHVAAHRRAHGVPAAGRGRARVRARQERQARLPAGGERVAGQRVHRGAPDGLDPGCITVESKPQFGIANFTVPEASGNFCSRGGRIGTHSSNESFTPAFYRKVAFLAHFNAGVRAIDVRNPFAPREIGYYIPAVTANTVPRCVTVDGQDRCKTAIQTNNVEVDDRGYVYIVDRANTGLHILRLTAEGREAAGLAR